METKAGMYYVTKQVEFAAAHRLYREELSESHNFRLFGACANPHGHGHNYLLEATFEGPLDPESQMVVHFGNLKQMLHELVVTPLDHRHLNHDVPLLTGILPTSENIVRMLWGRISSHSQGQPWRLFKLRLGSSARNWVEYYG